MGKHIADPPREHDKDGRLERYTEIERKKGDDPGKASKTLHRQEKPLDNEERLKRYIDKDRKGD